MIPGHLQGKSAEDIKEAMTYRAYHTTDSKIPFTDYIEKLEGLLLLAVKDALCNADATGKLHTQRAYDAEDRAVAFLNEVLPYKE